MAPMAIMAHLLKPPLSAVSLRACRVLKWVGAAVLALIDVLLLDVLKALAHFWIPLMTLEVMVTLRQGAVEVVLVVAVLGDTE
jgi:hypothetical protein